MMGLLDPFVNGLWYALGLGRKTKKFKRTDPAEFKAGLGDFIIFNVSAINPDFLQGGIQGGQQQQDDKINDNGSFWQHTGGARRMPDGSFQTIEAFAKGITYGNLEEYLTDKFQLEAFSFPWDAAQIEKTWTLAEKFVGKKYDIGEILCDILPTQLAELLDDKNENVCSSLWAVIMDRMYWPVVKKGINVNRATPGDIHDGCYPQMKLKYSPFNF